MRCAFSLTRDPTTQFNGRVEAHTPIIATPIHVVNRAEFVDAIACRSVSNRIIEFVQRRRCCVVLYCGGNFTCSAQDSV